MTQQLQHYVPRFLLRQFGSGKKDYVHIYDKQKGKTFKLSAGNKGMIPVAAERGMYDFEFVGVPVSMEQGLSQQEAKAAQHIARIVKDGRLHPEDPMERGTLAVFLAVQMVRTRAVLEMNADIFGRMKSWLDEQGVARDFFAPDPHVGEGENAQKALMARQIANAHRDYAPVLLEKVWLLLRTDVRSPFLMGDHPIALFNDVERPGRGNLGIAVEGIQIYFPLSPTLALALWCLTIPEMLRKFVSMMADRSESHPHEMGPHVQPWRDAIATLEALNNSTPLLYRPENVEHFNSLQVAHAERFVFSSHSDFSFVEKMVGSEPLLRRGRRMSEMTGKF